MKINKLIATSLMLPWLASCAQDAGDKQILGTMIGAAGLTVIDGEASMERARLIKSAEELLCPRHAIAVAEVFSRFPFEEMLL